MLGTWKWKWKWEGKAPLGSALHAHHTARQQQRVDGWVNCFMSYRASLPFEGRTKRFRPGVVLSFAGSLLSLHPLVYFLPHRGETGKHQTKQIMINLRTRVFFCERLWPLAKFACLLARSVGDVILRRYWVPHLPTLPAETIPGDGRGSKGPTIYI